MNEDKPKLAIKYLDGFDPLTGAKYYLCGLHQESDKIFFPITTEEELPSGFKTEVKAVSVEIQIRDRAFLIPSIEAVFIEGLSSVCYIEVDKLEEHF